MKKLFQPDSYLLKFFLAFLLFFTSAVLYSQTSPVLIPAGGFKIDGALRANVTTAAGDWVPRLNSQVFTAGVDSFALDASGAPKDNVTTRLKRDVFGTTTDDIFTQGSKFNDYISALRWGTGGAPNKNDIHNGMFHASGDASGNQWVFIGGDRLDVAGTSYIDFQFLQGTVTPNAAAGTFTGSGPHGGRTISDINISMEYNNGGSAPKVVIYRWAPTNEAGTAWGWDSTGSAAITQAYAKTNLASTDVPFGAFNGTTYQAFAFVEAAVNVTQLITAVGGNCTGLSIKTLWITTKASSSSTAALKDFIEPISLDLTFGGVTINPIGPFCAGASNVTLTGSPSGGTFSGPGVTGTTFSPTDAGVGTHTIVYQASAGVNCTKTTSMQVVINPNPATTDPTDQTVCNNTSTSAVTFSSPVTGATFAWTNNTTSIGLAASGSGNIAAFNATNSGTSNVIATIQVSATANGCTGAPQTFTITVKPTPTVDDPVDQTLCNNTLTNAVNFSGAVAGTTFAWTNNNTSINLGASGSGNIAAFTATNSGTTNAVATITVTPTANSCSGSQQQFTITVKPTPNVTDPTDQSLCAGASTNAVSFSGGVAGTVFNWTNNTTSIGLAASGSGNISSFVAQNAGPGNVTATTTVTPTANSCSGPSQNFTITVNANPAQPAVNVIQATCAVTTGTVTVTSPLDGGGIDYEYNNNSGAYQDNVDFVLAAGSSYSIKARIKATGCISVAITGTLGTPASTPPAIAIITQNVDCSNSTGKVKIVQASAGNPEYDNTIYEFSNDGVVYGSNPEFTFTAGGGYDLTVRKKSDHTCTAGASCPAESSGARTTATAITESSARILGAATLETASVTVNAIPNPFSDKVRFMISNNEAGSGTLDIYNMTGQKIKTIYQGIIPAGVSYFDLTLSTRQTANLVYVLKIGDRQLTGKIVQVNSQRN